MWNLSKLFVLKCQAFDFTLFESQTTEDVTVKFHFCLWCCNGLMLKMSERNGLLNLCVTFMSHIINNVVNSLTLEVIL